MGTEIKNKKTLLLSGGINLACDIVEKAKEMGVYVIVADWNEGSPAKLIADESYLISTRDIDGMVALAREKNVDGIITQYIDSNLPYVQKICEMLGKSFIATAEQLELIGNKEKSKQLCIDCGVAVPHQYEIPSSQRLEELIHITYPVIVKPVDSSGQKGISVCNNADELIKGYSFAVDNSETRRAIVEEYITGDYVVICFTMKDGQLSLTAMADKTVVSENYADGHARLPIAYTLPSKHLDIMTSDYIDQFQKMARKIGLENGSWGMEAVVKNGQAYIFEMQYRLGGIKHHNMFLAEYGIDLLKMHIEHSICGVFGKNVVFKKNMARFKRTYCLLNIILAPGVISRVQGVDEIMKISEVIDVVPMRVVGDRICRTGTVNDIWGKISIVAMSHEHMRGVVNNIYRLLRVIGDKTENMVLGFQIN